jgi:hypothetical protein
VCGEGVGVCGEGIGACGEGVGVCKVKCRDSGKRQLKGEGERSLGKSGKRDQEGVRVGRSSI